MSIKSQYLWHLNWWMKPFWDSSLTHQFYKTLNYLHTMETSIFDYKTHLHLPPLIIWAVYGSWYDPGNQNEDHYFIKYWIRDHWHWSQCYRFITDLISKPNPHDHDKLIALVSTTFDHMAHFPDLGITPLSQIIGINSASHEAADLARSIKSIKIMFYLEYGPDTHSCLDLSCSCVYQFLWFRFTLPCQ